MPQHLGVHCITSATTLAKTLKVVGDSTFDNRISVGTTAVISSTLSVGNDTAIVGDATIKSKLNAAAESIYAGADITSASDRTFKTNIETIRNPLDYVNKLRGVYFNWKTKEFHNTKKVDKLV